VVIFIGAGTGMAVGGIKGNYARVNPIRREIQMLYIQDYRNNDRNGENG
jgi:hypothetical protein